MTKLEKAFWKFHEAHPQVYDALVSRARDWQYHMGCEHLGISTIYEHLRYTMALNSRDAHGIKLNNNHRPYYARLIMRQEPDLDGIFTVKKQRIESTLGPDNDGLESSEHNS